MHHGVVAGKDAVAGVLTWYPKIFFACHTRHVRDPKSKRLLSAHQASILDHLDEHDAITLMGLARHMGVTPSTMSLTIDRLERMGYVSRARDTNDGRRVNLLLSTAGLRIKKLQSVLDPQRVRRMLVLLDEGERAKALRGLELLARAAEEFMSHNVPQYYGLQQAKPVKPALSPSRSRFRRNS